MTEQATSNVSMKLGSSYLHRKVEQLMDSPPTQAALILHIKRATYQAGHCWAQMTTAVQNLPSPNDWGWNKKVEGGWEARWTTLPEGL